MKITKIYNLLLFFFLLNLSMGANFGKNIVQYKDFDWYYVQTQHFDIYVSDSTGYHIEFLQKTSEDAYNKIQKMFDWQLRERVSIIIYSSHNDFQQTNVVGSHLPEGVGGLTELLKNRVVIPFDGSYREFKHVIYHELVHAFVNDCIYGGSLKNMIANQISVRIPLWMNEGLAEYLANKWDTNSDMWIRDLVVNGDRLPHINELNGYWAYRGGQSVWNFITEKWGDEAISEIIKKIKSKGSVVKGLKAAISVDLDELNSQWHRHLKKNYWGEIKNEEIKDISTQLTDHEKLKNHYNIAPAISPNGNQVAIFSDKDGTMNLILINSLDGQTVNKVIEGERNSQFEELHILKPGITWSPDGEQIAVAVKSGKSDALIFINLENNKKDVKRFKLQGVFRPTWHPKENLIAFIGNNGFSSDVYVYDIDSDMLLNITDDWYSDDHVSWDETGESLFFISNRGDQMYPENNRQPSESILESINLEQYDIYKLSFETRSMERITDTEFDESYPFYSNSNQFLGYVSDANGINNIYIRPDSVSQSIPITNVVTGITQMSWNKSTKQLIFTGFNRSGYDIFTIYDPKKLIYRGISLSNANWKNKKHNRHEVSLKTNYSLPESKESKKYTNYVFNDIDKSKNKIKIDKKENKVINKNYSKLDLSNKYRMYKYKTRYTLDYADVNYSYSNQRGSSGLVNIVFSDILGDHKIVINTEMEIRLKSSDYLLTYYNLSNKIDWMFGFYHFGQEVYAYQYVEYSDGIYRDWVPSIRYQTLGITVAPSFPINKFQRIDFGFDFTQYSKQYLIWENRYDYDEIDDSEYRKKFFIPYLQYNYDNTLWDETYPVKGKRVYLRFLNSSLNTALSSPAFYSVTLDARAYSSLKNKMSTAIRFFGGNIGGSDYKNAMFRVGGTTYLPFLNKNQADSQYELYYDTHSSQDQIYYNQYVMPVRGVPVGAKKGSNVLVINAEFRLPFLIYYFPAIGSLGKINGVFFTDLAATWDEDFPSFNDPNQWDEDLEYSNGYNLYEDYRTGNLNRRTKTDGWVWTFGFGPRFIFFGMPWQIDFAWQYNPITKDFSSRRWYASLGLDF